MKRIISLLLVAVMCLSLCACGKSEAVTAFEDAVAQIGTVSIDSEEKIAAAEAAYEALTDKEKESVAELYTALTENRSTLDRLSAVVALIDAIGDVTVDSEAAIVAAENAYNELSDDDKALIADYAQKLADSTAAYNKAVEEKLSSEAAVVSAEISAIGNVTLDSKSAIKAARNSYNALSADAKLYVTNYSALEAAEKEFDALWSTEKERIINEYSKKFEIDTDPVQGITWYMHDNMPNYIDTRCYIIPYIGMQGNTPWICIRYNYTEDDWIFWEKLTIVADGKKDYKYVGAFDTIRDNDGGVVWEYYDEALNYNQGMDSEELEMLARIADSSETIIRFEGDEYYYDLYVSNKDKQMIRDTLTLYEALLG